MRTMLKGLMGAALASAMLLSLPAAAGADDQGRERRDARRFRELQTDLREAGDREAQLLEQAVEQARENEGRSEPSTLAALTNVMEKQDRLRHHLRELALRNGWDMPAEGDAATDTAPAGALGRMVGRASAAVQEELAEEAREIAARLELPLLPLPPSAPAAEDSEDDADGAEAASETEADDADDAEDEGDGR
jgi:hypothetical protein